MRWIINALRDPAWQMISAVVAIVAVFLATATDDTARPQLSIVHDSRSDLSRQWLPDSRFQIFHNDSKFDVNRTVLDYFLIINDSSRALEGKDFLEPLTVAVDSPMGKLVSVENCSYQAGKACRPDQQLTRPSFADLSWSLANGNWQATPTLLNPGERACVIAVLERQSDSDANVFDVSPTWTARIRGINVAQFPSSEAYDSSFPRELASYWYMFAYLDTTGIIWFSVLFFTFFVSFVQLAILSRTVAIDSMKGAIQLASLGVVAMMSAQILVARFVDGQNGDNLHPVVWVWASIAVAVFLFLAIKAVRFKAGRLEGHHQDE